MSEENTTILQPTFQSVFMASLHAIVGNMNAHNLIETWESEKIAYTILPPKCYKDCEKKFKETEEHLKALTKRSGFFTNSLQKETLKDVSNYLRVNNFVFLRLMIDSLHKHGYLEKMWHPINEHDFEDTPEITP